LNIFNVHKFPPKIVGKDTTSHRRLQVEAKNRDYRSNSSDPVEYFLFCPVLQPAHAQQPHVVAQVRCDFCLFNSLLRRTTYTGYLNKRPLQSSFFYFFRCQGQYFFEKIDFRIPDRKSTRLNSSHVSISYAVFCLKKKTKQ